VYGRQDGAWVDAGGSGGGASDVDELTTTTGSATNMLRVARGGGLEYRTTAQVLSDIGAAASSHSHTLSNITDSGTMAAADTADYYTSAQTDSAIDADVSTHAALTSGVHGLGTMAGETATDYLTAASPTVTSGDLTLPSGGAILPASDGTAAIVLANAAGTSDLLVLDTTNESVGVNTAPSSDYELDVLSDTGTEGARVRKKYAASVSRDIFIIEAEATAGDPIDGFGGGLAFRRTGNSGSDDIALAAYTDSNYLFGKLQVSTGSNVFFTAAYGSGPAFGIGSGSPLSPLHVRQSTGGAVDVVATFEFDKTGTPVDGESAYNQYLLDSTTTAQQDVANVTWSWAEAAHATRKGKYAITVFDTAERDGISIEADGSQANTTVHGDLIVPNMPTSDPAVAGALWSDGGTVKISAG